MHSKLLQKTAIEKNSRGNHDLIANKIVDKITSTVQSNVESALQTDEEFIEIPKERYIPRKKTRTGDMVKHELRVTRCELRVTSYDLKA